MKKILYGAALLALAAGCAENELDSLSTQQNKIEGVAFKAELEEPVTRAEWEKTGTTWNMFWYAERDKMDIYVKNASIGAPDAPLVENETAGVREQQTNIADWNVTNGKTTYKASRTLGEGYFVADDNSEVINFTRKKMNGVWSWNKPSFRYVWPATTEVKSVEGALVATLPTLKDQNQTDMNGASTIKYAFMSGKMDNVEIPNDSASGADVLIGMKLSRKFPLAVYSVKNYDDNKDLFGKLVSITLVSNGQKKADGKVDENEEKKEDVDYGAGAKWNLHTDAFTQAETTAKEVKLEIGTGGKGMEWKDGATAFMTINSVNRSGNTLKSNYSVVYKFENVTITDNFDTKANWLGGQIVRMSGTTAEPDFDLKSQPYTLIKNGDEDTYTLMINPSFEGKVADIIVGTDVKDLYDNIPYVSTDEKNEVVPIGAVTKLIVAPDVEDPTTFAKFTALTEVTLEGEKELVAGMFSAGGLTKLEADRVTKVAKLFNKDANGKAVAPAYQTLVMPAYEFNESKEINANFFNDMTKGSLETLDISGVQDMAVPFEDITLAFVGYGALKTVTVKEGVNVSQNAFKGCGELVNFTGSVNLTTFDATNAFSGTAITAISVVGSKIPADAFNNCVDLETVTFDTSKLTEIGANAFKGCGALYYMDLSNVTTLGQYAFANSGLKAPNADTNVMVVGASKLPYCVFMGTNVSLVRFTHATEIGDGILYLCNKLSQVRFDKAFTYEKGVKIGAQTLGKAEGVTLYVDKANQKNVSGSVLNVPKKYSGNAVSEWQQINFKGIYDNAYWKE